MAGFFAVSTRCVPLLACASLIALASASDTADARTPAQVRYAQHADDMFFAIDYRPRLTTPSHRNLIIALDTSRSMAGTPFAKARALATGVRSELARKTRVRLVHGDYRSRRCRARMLECLRALEPGGASDLGALLGTAIAEARALPGPSSILLISDGTPSLGPRLPSALIAAAKRRIGGRDISVHTVPVGHEINTRLLRRLAEELAGLYSDAEPRVLAASLMDTVVTDVAVTAVAGDVLEIVGTDTGNLPASAGFTVLGKLVSGTATVRLRGRVVGPSAGRSGTHSIDRLVTIDPRGKSRDPHLVTRWARMAIAEIKAEQPENLELIEHIEETYLPPPAEVEERVSTGYLPIRQRVVTVTCGGFGRAPVRIRGARTKRIVRRAVRARAPAIRHCYERALRRDRHLAGTVKVQFWLAPDGSVHDPLLSDSDLFSSEVESCVLDVVKTIKAPATPEGDTWEQVHYPFEFQPIYTHFEPVSKLAEIVDSHLADARREQALEVIRKRERALVANRLDLGGLLPLLRSQAARTAFPGYFARAARARLSRPALPMAVADDLFRHFARTEPRRSVSLFARVWVDRDTGARMLRALAAHKRPDLARALGRAWQRERGPQPVYAMLAGDYSERANDDQLRYEVARALLASGDERAQSMDDFLASALAVGERSNARAQVMRRCERLEGQKNQCTAWLGRFARHPEVRQRLAALYRPVVAAALRDRRANPEYNFADSELAEALAHVGEMPAAVRALSEELEQDPGGPEVERDFALGLLRLRQNRLACRHLRGLAARQSETDTAGYIAAAYEDAWQRPAPADLCR